MLVGWTDILNREPREFEYLRCLVDGSHWNGQKKLRHSDNNGRGGHLGCSDSFNFNIYKKFLREGTYSQGREQMHSKLTKLSTSLQQMNYRNHMTFLRLLLNSGPGTSQAGPELVLFSPGVCLSVCLYVCLSVRRHTL